ncbi:MULTISPECIES: hypothetical protein [Rhodobacterales]|uniref:hypothetical protein n=1 Tax=Rhodobacterales TaxID=204455 RepID=UPI0011BDBFFD|nr:MULTISPECIES: hypothetical protein [Rhodobacterales]MDO6590354.1 hypothetical protein [Yoonia sp. 1_MG-2023]
MLPTNVAAHADVATLGAYAAQSRALLQGALHIPDACTLIVRSNDRTSVASLQGSLICEGTQSLNIGLLLPKLRALDSHAAELKPENIRAGTAQRQILLALCARIARSEATRVFVLRAGQNEIVLQAHRGYFNILNGATSPIEIAKAIQNAAEDGKEAAYSLGDNSELAVRYTYPISSLLAPNNDKSTHAWDIDVNGDFLSAPITASSEIISGMLHLQEIACELSSSEEISSIEVRRADGTIIGTLRFVS